MIKLDWRVTAKQTIDKDTYRSFSSDHDVFAKVLFKETLCKDDVSANVMLIVCIVIGAILFITCITVLICRWRGWCCFRQYDKVEEVEEKHNPFDIEGAEITVERKKKQRSKIKFEPTDYADGS